LFDIFLLEFRREFHEMIKYKINIIFANLSLFVLFMGLLSYFNFGNKELTFFMLFIWYFITHSLTIPSFIMENEVFDGTLSSLFQSRVGLLKIMFERCILQIILDSMKGIPLFFILALIQKINIINYRTIIILAIAYIVILSMYGLGILFSGLVFKFSRISTLIGLLGYFILFFTNFIGKSISSPSLFTFILPFDFLKKIIINILNHTYAFNMIYIFLIIQLSFYLLSGIIGLRLALKHAQKRGYLFVC